MSESPNILTSDSIVAAITDDLSLHAWLEGQATACGLSYVLAHADDGVIWGQFIDSTLRTADHAFPQFAPLRLCTLQQCRVFGDTAELLLWRIDRRFKARLLRERDGQAPDLLAWTGNGWRLHKHATTTGHTIDERHILWGTRAEEEKDGFTMLSEGQGLRHAVPLTGIQFDEGHMERPAGLLVRHYIAYDDETGVARIALSRLVRLDQK